MKEYTVIWVMDGPVTCTTVTTARDPRSMSDADWVRAAYAADFPDEENPFEDEEDSPSFELAGVFRGEVEWVH